MENQQRYTIRKKGPQSDEYEIVLYMDDQFTEFGTELGREPSSRKNIVTTARQILAERYPNIKVTVVKVMLGGMVIASIPLGAEASTAQASEKNGTTSIYTQGAQSDMIYYKVSPGDTLWLLSQRFNTSIDQIKRANQLTSDVLSLNQPLIIPQAFHTVATGDYLSVLAKKYGTTIDAIKQANRLTNDATQLGQTLVIPAVIDGLRINPVQSTSQHTNQIETTTYKVVPGDSLSVIAKRFGTTVEALKRDNQLTSDMLFVGQTLKVQQSGYADAVQKSASDGLAQTPAGENIHHKVAYGDSLWGIANKYNVSLDSIRRSNNLDSDLLQVGQNLVIPKGKTTNQTPAPPPAAPPTNLQYTVKAGDSLSLIAKRLNVSVEQIKAANHLTSDMIRVGQVLTVPEVQATGNGETSPSTTVNSSLVEVQKNLQKLGYYAVPALTGSYDSPTTSAIKDFQKDYRLAVTGTINETTNTAIEHALVKQDIIKDSTSYRGIPYLWGGTTPSGFDCSGFVYFMFNKHGVNMARNTSAGLYTQGTPIQRENLQPGDLVFFAVNTTGTITHVGFYMGDNQFISATSSKGINAVSMDNSYWAKYYVGAKRI